jgi:hypothetical protein
MNLLMAVALNGHYRDLADPQADAGINHAFTAIAQPQREAVMLVGARIKGDGGQTTGDERKPIHNRFPLPTFIVAFSVLRGGATPLGGGGGPRGLPRASTTGALTTHAGTSGHAHIVEIQFRRRHPRGGKHKAHGV